MDGGKLERQPVSSVIRPQSELTAENEAIFLMGFPPPSCCGKVSRIIWGVCCCEVGDRRRPHKTSRSSDIGVHLSKAAASSQSLRGSLQEAGIIWGEYDVASEIEVGIEVMKPKVKRKQGG